MYKSEVVPTVLSELPSGGKYRLVSERPNERKYNRVRHCNDGFGCAGGKVEENAGRQDEEQQSCV